METYVNDTVQITLDTKIDLSGYATLQILYRKPDGTTGCWSAGLCPTDNNCMTYVCVYGDLDQDGKWLIQAMALDAGVKLTGLWIEFEVHDALAPSCTTMAPTTVVPTTPAP